MASRLYALPPSLGDRVPEDQYLKWLQQKAQSLVKRDRKRDIAHATISKYSNEEAREAKRKVKLPERVAINDGGGRITS